MKEDELIKEAEDALYELEKKHAHHGNERIDKGDDEKRNPFAYLIVVILIVLVVMMAVPYYSIKLDPTPKSIPSLPEVIPSDVDKLAKDMPGSADSARQNYRKMLVPENSAIRNLAVRVSTSSCRESQICYSKALFYFVRDNIQYVADPPDGYLESPFETLLSDGADCEGMAILLANLQMAVGVPVRFAFIPNHVFIQVKIDDALRKYKEEDGWISLDATCNDCEFGELPYSTMNKLKEFMYP